MRWLDEIVARAEPAVEVAPSERSVLVAVVIALAVVATLVWRVVRVGVTLVHELGHALVGVLMGRRFTGFVVNGDMSGHTVTVGKGSGFGLVATIWAGYPAPAVFGLLLVMAAMRGWSAPVITAVMVVLVFAVIRLRSVLTAVVLGVALLSVGALWWWRADDLQATALVAVGLILQVGAWRQFLAVAKTREQGSDPARLAALTHLPRLAWNATFLVVIVAAMVVAGWELAHTVGLAPGIP